MPYELFTRVALREDIPPLTLPSQHRLRRGDVATIVDRHQGSEGEEDGYSLEVFNALGETIAVLVVEASNIEPHALAEQAHG